MQNRSIDLTFHGIGEPARSLGLGEQAVWVSREQFLAVLDAAAEHGDVRITFDDGNASDVEHALSALRERGLTASFFVVAGRLGTRGFLDASGVRALAAAGMTIGCHGMHHVPWRHLDERALHEELVGAKRIIEEIVERPVTEVACPFGSYDRRVLRSLRRYEYRTVYTSDGGTTASNDWLQTRNTVRWGDGAGVVEQILSAERPHRAALRRAKQVAKRWR